MCCVCVYKTPMANAAKQTVINGETTIYVGRGGVSIGCLADIALQMLPGPPQVFLSFYM